jgi:hypothetical protein
MNTDDEVNLIGAWLSRLTLRNTSGRSQIVDPQMRQRVEAELERLNPTSEAASNTKNQHTSLEDVTLVQRFVNGRSPKADGQQGELRMRIANELDRLA